jgi:hypothetical protein
MSDRSVPDSGFSLTSRDLDGGSECSNQSLLCLNLKHASGERSVSVFLDGLLSRLRRDRLYQVCDNTQTFETFARHSPEIHAVRAKTGM